MFYLHCTLLFNVHAFMGILLYRNWILLITGALCLPTENTLKKPGGKIVPFTYCIWYFCVVCVKVCYYAFMQSVKIFALEIFKMLNWVFVMLRIDSWVGYTYIYVYLYSLHFLQDQIWLYFILKIDNLP